MRRDVDTGSDGRTVGGEGRAVGLGATLAGGTVSRMVDVARGTSWRRGATLLSVALAAAGLLSACGSSKPAASSSEPATLKVASTSYGKILETPSGQVLYALTADTATHDACSGACLAIWPPLTVKKTPVAGSGVSASMLSTLKLSDGSLQVVYDGHPLYTFSGDSAAGQTKGQGLPFPASSSSPTGHWWVVSSAGSYVTTSSSSSTTSTTTSSGYGGY